MLVWVVCLAECLLSCHVTWVSSEHTLRSWGSISWELAVRVHRGTIVESFLFFFCAFFEKHFSQYIFFLLVWVIIFHVIIMRLIENAVGVVIAVGIFVSYSAGLTHWAIGIDTKATWDSWYLSVLLSISLASYQQNTFVEPTDYWDFWLCLLLLLLLLWLLRSLLRSRLFALSWLLHWTALCVCTLTFVLTLIWCATLRRLHVATPSIWILFWRRSLQSILFVILRAWTRSFLEKYLLVLL